MHLLRLIVWNRLRLITIIITANIILIYLIFLFIKRLGDIKPKATKFPYRVTESLVISRAIIL